MVNTRMMSRRIDFCLSMSQFSANTYLTCAKKTSWHVLSVQNKLLSPRIEL